MAGQDNLIPVRTKEEARERGTNGGIASGEARRKRKTLREELIALLDSGDTQERMSVALIREATMGNSAGSVARAWETVRDTIGEKPTENMNVTATMKSSYDDLTADELRELLKKHDDGAI